MPRNYQLTWDPALSAPLSPASILPAGFSGSLVFNDEFSSGSAPSNNYRSYYGISAAANAGLASTFAADLSTNPNYGVPDNQDGGITSASSTVGGGVLSIGAAKTSCTIGGVSKPWTRGLVRTAASYQYGYFEASLKLPARAAGLWPGFWLWPANPADLGEWQEIDIVEQPGTVISGITHNVIWGDTTTPTQSGPVTAPGTFSDRFYLFGCWWTSSFIKFYIDGVETVAARYTDAAHIPHVPMTVVLDYQIGGAGSWPGAPDGSTPTSSKLEVDCLRVYQ